MLKFWRGKRVFITGFNGFKGTWLCKILELAGADVTGYALTPQSADQSKVIEAANILADMKVIYGDVRDIDTLMKGLAESQPEIVVHLAAQPIVLTGYAQPKLTYETNVMGTVNLLECVRRQETVRSVLNITTDKVYQNQEWIWGYRENEALQGYDPYSNSKSCSELVTQSYRLSFFKDLQTAVSTARAGNVIGGGDFAPNRIIPDCIRAAYNDVPIELRNPHSVRPYQHVLEPLFAYLLICERQYLDKQIEGAYNVGPDEEDCVTTEKLVKIFCKYWSNGVTYRKQNMDGPHEASFLKLDCSKLKSTMGWSPIWDIEKAVKETVEWARTYQARGNIADCMEQQVRSYAANYEKVIK